MTSLVTVKKEVEKLKERLTWKPEDVITIYMWRPEGFPDKPYKLGDRIRIKALKVKHGE